MTAPITAHFLTDIEIKEFKCFKDFKASGFKRVNLIGGKNNVGKTAFMEACFINVHSLDAITMTTAIGRIKYFREIINSTDRDYSDDFYLNSTKNYATRSNLSYKSFSIRDKDWKKEYWFNVDNKEIIVKSGEFEIRVTDIDNIEFIDNFGWSDKHLSYTYQVIQHKNKEEELNTFVTEFDNSIEKFKIIGDKPQCQVNSEYRDITEFGDGLKHYISIICALVACENGYLFIDEIDNGIYYDHLDRLWEIIFKISKETKCQIFATTHSKEMLESFARVAKKLDEQDISYTLLVKNKQQEIKTITSDYEMLLDSIEQKREVRGW